MKNRLRLFIWIPRILNLALAAAFIILAFNHLNSSEIRFVSSWNFYLFFSPGILILLLLSISWQQPLAGGILFTSVAIMLLFLDSESPFLNPFTLPILVTGLFYWMSYWLQKQTT